MTEEKIREILPHLCYTKEEVDVLIRAAVDEARAIDEASMAKHNREANYHQYDFRIHLPSIICRWFA